MTEETVNLWFLISIVAVAVLWSWLRSWSRKQRVRKEKGAQRANRATVRDRSDQVKATLWVEARTAHQRIPGLTAAEKQRLLAKYGGCAYCDTAVVEGLNLHWDHVLPLTLGGANHLSNVVPSCVPCNLRKGSKHPSRWLTEIGRKLDMEGVASQTVKQGLMEDRVKDAEFTLLVAGNGIRAERARRVLEGVSKSDEVLAARLDGARDALNHLAQEWRGQYRPASSYRRGIIRYPEPTEKVAVAYKRVRELERRSSAPRRTLAQVSRGRIEVRQVSAEAFRSQEETRDGFIKNIWGVRPR